jgi:hypothetical protein
MARGTRQAEPGRRNPAGGTRQAEPGRRNPAGGTRQAEPGRRNPAGGTRQAEPGRRNPAGGTRQAEPGRRNPAGGRRNRQAEPGRRNPAGGTRQAEPGRRNPAGGTRQADPRRIAEGGSRQADCVQADPDRATAHGPRPTAHDSRHTFQQPVGWHPGASLTANNNRAKENPPLATPAGVPVSGGDYAATARRRVSINPWSAITILRAAIVAPWHKPHVSHCVRCPPSFDAGHMDSVASVGASCLRTRNVRQPFAIASTVSDSDCPRSPCKGLSVPRRSACAIGEYNPCGSSRARCCFPYARRYRRRVAI